MPNNGGRSYNGRLKRLLDIIVFDDPHDPDFSRHICWNCQRTFWANNKHIRFCCDDCRTRYHNFDERGSGRWVESRGRVVERQTPSNWLQDVILGEEI